MKHIRKQNSVLLECYINAIKFKFKFLDQLLVTSQVSYCTGEGGATVCPIASCLVVRVATQ